jgi:hypothetical protein
MSCFISAIVLHTVAGHAADDKTPDFEIAAAGLPMYLW